jgi:succinate dehydrogenase / fumarate reductase, cytochrome b subunit
MRQTDPRPLSPHLQIYRPMLTMMLSIIHRITGSALYFGSTLLVWWVFAVALGPDSYATFQSVAGSIPGQLILFGFTWALVHHLIGGLRHLVWDTGRGFDLATVELMARLSIAASVTITLVIWGLVLFSGGNP